jgi:2-polyprenyl-3-methyl-5-hydroxy-6-metoxy-1,4-benzoquinol methylase
VHEEFRHPRLAAIYDALDPDRGDLDVYLALIGELDVERVLDVGCGTGTFALLLARRGYDVVAVDPAAASIEVARGKPGADRVRWVRGDATAVSVTDRDVATMTANVVQHIEDPAHWQTTLRAVGAALRPGGYVVFETRDPAARAWERWTREATYRRTEVRGEGNVETWVEVTDLSWPLVRIRGTFVFASDGTTLTSDSTLRYRERDEVEASLLDNGFEVSQVRDAPDRPGREFVFVARRTG